MPPPIERAERQFGKYRLIAHIASGGMAEIHIASHEQLAGFEKIVVVKRMLPHLKGRPDFVEMFLEEARTAARLNHPNTVQIFELGEIEGSYFIAMEYLAGESLASTISTLARARKRFPSDLAAGIVMQAAEGLHHAHTLKGSDGEPLLLIHRDISPPNIFVLYDGGVKVVDFGVAKHSARLAQTRVGVLKGKLGYMSPEQIKHDEVDARSDIFSLGVVLWECLTCRKLFRGNEYDSMRATAETDAPSPRAVYAKIPLELERITLKALARDRDQRYQTAAELRGDLASYLRASAAEADTVAIGGLMMQLFSDRAEKKQALFTRAREGVAVPEEEIDSVWQGPEEQSTPSVPQKTPEASGPTIIPLPTAAPTLEPPPPASADDLDHAEGFVVLEPTVRMPSPFEPEAQPPVAAPADGDFLDRTPMEPVADEAPQQGVPRPPRRTRTTVVIASIAGVLFGLLLIVWYSRSSSDRSPQAEDGAQVVLALFDAAVAEDDPAQTATPDAAATSEGAADSGAPDVQSARAPDATDAALPDTSPAQQARPSDREAGTRERGARAGASSKDKARHRKKRVEESKERSSGVARTGTLRLQTTPWAIIYHKGRKLGESPLIDVKLPAGKLTLRAVNSAEGIDVPIKIEIKPDQRTAKSVSLR